MLTKTSSGTRILIIYKDDINELINGFQRFCRVDLRHSEGTAFRRSQDAKRFLLWCEVERITRETVRGFLEKFISLSPHTYCRILCSLRIFFRDYLEREDLIKTFRFPSKSFKPIIVPSKEDLQQFFNALRMPKYKALFLMYCTTGLRESEVLSLKFDDIDFAKQMIIPKKNSRTKQTYVTFYNEEAERYLKSYLQTRKDNDPRLFPNERRTVVKMFGKASKRASVKITIKMLRAWFACEMGELGVPDRYIDAFCGRTPKSMLARHYTDYSPQRLKRIYDKAGLKVLS